MSTEAAVDRSSGTAANVRSRLPSVDRLLALPQALRLQDGFGRAATLNAVRESLAQARAMAGGAVPDDGDAAPRRRSAA